MGMVPGRISSAVFFAAAAAMLTFIGCAKKTVVDDTTNPNCATPGADNSSTKTGSAYIFQPDPIVRSGKADLSPTSLESVRPHRAAR